MLTYHPSYLLVVALDRLCFCQAKKYPFDNRKMTHLRGYRITLNLFSLTKIVDIKLANYLFLPSFSTVLLDYRTFD